jgi:hypothetical protein
MAEPTEALPLRFVLYKLFYLDDVDDARAFGDDFAELVRRDYTAEQIHDVFAALEWALAHPDYDFGSLLPGLRHSNPEILRYLHHVHRRFVAEGLDSG